MACADSEGSESSLSRRSRSLRRARQLRAREVSERKLQAAYQRVELLERQIMCMCRHDSATPVDDRCEAVRRSMYVHWSACQSLQRDVHSANQASVFLFQLGLVDYQELLDHRNIHIRANVARHCGFFSLHGFDSCSRRSFARFNALAAIPLWPQRAAKLQSLQPRASSTYSICMEMPAASPTCQWAARSLTWRQTFLLLTAPLLASRKSNTSLRITLASIALPARLTTGLLFPGLPLLNSV